MVVHQVGNAASSRKKRKEEKTTPVGVNLMRSQALHRAAQVCIKHKVPLSCAARVEGSSIMQVSRFVTYSRTKCRWKMYTHLVCIKALKMSLLFWRKERMNESEFGESCSSQVG
jgi:hypothetical protein